MAAGNNTSASLTISGTTVTWSAESEGGLFAGNGVVAMEDPAHARVLSFGNLVFDPSTMKGHVEPNIRQLGLGGAPYTWTSMPFGGDAPPNSDNTFAGNFTVYDATGNRVLASAPHDSTCGAIPCTISGLWSFDLGSSTWTKVQDQWSDPHAYGGSAYLVDQDGRRVLEPSDGALLSTSLDTAKNPQLAGVALPMVGDLGTSGARGLAVRADQHIVPRAARRSGSSTRAQRRRAGSASAPRRGRPRCRGPSRSLRIRARGRSSRSAPRASAAARRPPASSTCSRSTGRASRR